MPRRFIKTSPISTRLPPQRMKNPRAPKLNSQPTIVIQRSGAKIILRLVPRYAISADRKARPCVAVSGFGGGVDSIWLKELTDIVAMVRSLT